MGLNPGQTFAERFVVDRLLGEGGFGAVYAGHQRSTGQRIAIKVLNASQAEREDASVARRFEREMGIIASLNHPNIVRLLDSGQSAEGELFAIMELVEGEDLAHLLAQHGPLEPFEARRLMGQVLDALSSAHARGVIHRDLKPHNIMVTRTGARRNAVVLDFGIAGILASEDAVDLETVSKITAAGQVPGTPAYMAPDQIEGRLTPQIDIYAWGLVFLECLTGQPAVTGATPLSTLLKHAQPQPVPIPEQIRNLPVGPVIARALEKQPELRYATAQEALDDLERLERGVLVGAPAGGQERSTHSMPRVDVDTARNPQQTTETRLLTLAVVLLLVLIAITVTVFVVLGGEDDESLPDPPSESLLGPSITQLERVAFDVLEVGEALRDVAWIPGSEHIVVGGERGALAIYDPGTGERVQTLTHAMMTPGLAVSPDGRWLAAGSMGISGFGVGLFELPGGERKHSWTLQGVPDGLGFSTDARRVALPSLAVELRSVGSGDVVGRLPAYEAPVVETLFTESGQVLVARGDGHVVLYDAETARELRAFTHPGTLSAAALGREGRVLITGFLSGDLQVWDVEGGQRISTMKSGVSVYDVALSADGRVLATACGDGTVQLWDVAEGELEKTLELGRRAPLMSVDFHPTQPRLIAGGKEGVVAQWTLRWEP